MAGGREGGGGGKEVGPGTVRHARAAFEFCDASKQNRAGGEEGIDTLTRHSAPPAVRLDTGLLHRCVQLGKIPANEAHEKQKSPRPHAYTPTHRDTRVFTYTCYGRGSPFFFCFFLPGMIT